MCVSKLDQTDQTGDIAEQMSLIVREVITNR